MSQDKVTKFGPGQEFRLDKRVIFVEYESMTGEFVKCRFDLSQKTEMRLNDYKILSFDDLTHLYSKGEDLFIKKVEYYEQECHMVIGDKLLIPTKVYFENAGYQQAYETNNKLLRNVANSAYGIASRDWGDVLADARHAQLPPIQVQEFIADDLEDCEKGVPNTKLMSGKLYFQDTTTGEMKPYEGVKDITPIASMTYKGVVYTNPTSEHGREGTMSRTPLYEKREYFQAEVGDVVLYSGKYFVWTGILTGWNEISNNGYFDTDMAMTREEMQYRLNDVAVTEKIFKEEQIMRFDSCKPTVKNVIFNAPATIVMWSDGTKTVVKCGENDVFDPEKGVAMCCMKKLLGTNKTGSNYLDKVQEYFDSYIEEAVNNVVIGEILSSIFGTSKKSTDIPPGVTVEKEFEVTKCNEDQVAEADGE